MKSLLESKQRFAALLLAALAVMVVMAACDTTSPTPTPTPSPTPTPTPTPTPVPDPIINLSADATFKDFIELLPADVVSCLVSELGQQAYDQILGEAVFGEDVAFDSELPLACFTQEAVVSLVIAGLMQAAGGLTDDTITCIRETFGGLELESLASLTSGDISGGAMGDALGVGIGLLLCLDDDEASRITAGGIFGDIGGASAISLADVRCVLQVVDIQELIGLAESFDTGGTPDLSTSLSLLTAFNDCGINLADLAGDGTSGAVDSPLDGTGDELGGLMDGGMTDGGTIPELDLSDLSSLPPEVQEPVKCMIDALGEDSINGLFAGTYTPTLEDFAALGACNLDLAQLGDLGSLISG